MPTTTGTLDCGAWVRLASIRSYSASSDFCTASVGNTDSKATSKVRPKPVAYSAVSSLRIQKKRRKRAIQCGLLGIAGGA